MADDVLAIAVTKEEGYPEFEAPQIESLADMEEGEEREVLAKIKRKPDGKLCLIEIEGYSLAEDEPDDDEEEPDEETEVQEEENEEIAGEDIGFAEGFMQQARSRNLV